MVRIRSFVAISLMFVSMTFAADNEYLLNFDLNTTQPESRGGYSIQLQGILLSTGRAFHGDDLGRYDYFLTVSDVKEGKGTLAIEFYEYETRKKKSAVVSEIVADVEFTLGSPSVFESKTDTFGIDFAFSIVEK